MSPYALKEEWYLALVLLVGGEIFRVVVRGADDLICSHNGISGIAKPFKFVESTELSSVLFMLLVLAILMLVFIYSEKLIRSPFGRMLKALRENEDVTRGLGKNITNRSRTSDVYRVVYCGDCRGVVCAEYRICQYQRLHCCHDTKRVGDGCIGWTWQYAGCGTRRIYHRMSATLHTKSLRSN